MVSQVLNTFDRHLVKVGKGFVLLCIVTCVGYPQQSASQDVPAIIQSEPPPAKEAPAKAASELTPEKAAPAPPRNAKVRELQEERLKVCQEIVKHMDVQFQQGVIPLEAGWDARETLLEAQLDLSETKADRIRIYQELVDGMESWHKIVKKLVEFAIINRTDELWVRSKLLKAKIALEKEKALPN